MDYCLITGMARSGTTLLEKMLNSHPQMSLLSQPMPLLYRHLKSEFYARIGYPDTYYVLNDLFHEFRYSQDDFFSFLENYEMSVEKLRTIFEEMEDWTGQWEDIKFEEIHFKEHNPQHFIRLYKNFLQRILDAEFKILGSKEVLVEEFVPYMVQNGVRVVLVIRDPRDVITSLNVGRGPDFAGAHRPTLFHLRNWRRSTAVANSVIGSYNFLVIRYEDLITQPYSTLSKVTDFLDIQNFANDHFENGIKSEYGNVWKGNSSTNKFRKVDPNNKNKFKKYLSTDTIKYIEYICHPEMDLWGYDLHHSELSSYDPISFKEPYDIQVDDLNSDMSTDHHEIELEVKRKKLLKQQTSSEDRIISFFYSEKNYQSLKKTMGG